MSDAFRPVTTSETLQSPKGYVMYTTQRDVRPEFPEPLVGAALTASNFIAGFSGHYVLHVHSYPKGDNKRVVVRHGPVPGGTFTEYASYAYVFPPIYPTAGGSGIVATGSRPRSRLTTGRITTQYAASPSTFAALAAVWDGSTPASGPFEVWSGIMEAAGQNFTSEDGSSGLVGDFLNQSFIGQNTINNPITVYAPGELLYNIAASTPDASTYNGWITLGTEIMASRTIHEWYCFYQLRTVFVKAQ
jgi:hypothetical protein